MDIACMEDSIRSWVPRFAQGLSVLLVDRDFGSLTRVARNLGLLGYKVTTADRGSKALSMIGDPKHEPFKLVMANVDMKETNILDFIQIVVQEDLPIILMTSRAHLAIARKGLYELGATCYFEKPLSMNDLRNVWQRAYSKSRYFLNGGVNRVKDTGSKQCSQLAQLRKRKEPSSDQAKSTPTAVKEDRRTPMWEGELNRKFKAALKQLGEDASVREIQKAMNVTHLSRGKIANHLERYRYRKSMATRPTTTTFPSATPSTSNNKRSRQKEPEKRREDLAIKDSILAAYKAAFPNQEAQPSFQQKCNFVSSFIAQYNQIQRSSTTSSVAPSVLEKFRTTFVKGNEELNPIQVSAASSTPKAVSGTPCIAEGFPKDFTTWNGEMSAMELLAPPPPKIQNNPLNDYDFVRGKLFEDEPDESTDLTNLPDPKVVDLYAELLWKELVSNPGSAPMEEVHSYQSSINRS